MRGASLPICRLDAPLRAAPPSSARAVRERSWSSRRSADRRLGFVVDELVGQQDIVIKALGKSLEGRARLRRRDRARRPARRARPRRRRADRRGARRQARRASSAAVEGGEGLSRWRSLVKHRAGRRAARRAGEAGQAHRVPRVRARRRDVRGADRALAEILRPPPITEVPRAPTQVIGVISVRGKLVTVVDLRRRLASPRRPSIGESRILLVESGAGEQIGLLVDEVQQVWRLAADEIEPASVLGGEQAAHIAGHRPAGRGRRRRCSSCSTCGPSWRRLRMMRSARTASPPPRPLEEPRRLHRRRRPLRGADRPREGDREPARDRRAPARAARRSSAWPTTAARSSRSSICAPASASLRADRTRKTKWIVVDVAGRPRRARRRRGHRGLRHGRRRATSDALRSAAATTCAASPASPTTTARSSSCSTLRVCETSPSRSPRQGQHRTGRRTRRDCRRGWPRERGRDRRPLAPAAGASPRLAGSRCSRSPRSGAARRPSCCCARWATTTGACARRRRSSRRGSSTARRSSRRSSRRSRTRSTSGCATRRSRRSWRSAPTRSAPRSRPSPDSTPTRASSPSEVLGGVPDARGTAALSRALHDEDANVRVTAAEALGNAALAGEESRDLATESLVAALATSDAFLKIAALDSLARLEARLPWSLFAAYVDDPAAAQATPSPRPRARASRRPCARWPSLPATRRRPSRAKRSWRWARSSPAGADDARPARACARAAIVSSETGRAGARRAARGRRGSAGARWRRSSCSGSSAPIGT